MWLGSGWSYGTPHYLAVVADLLIVGGGGGSGSGNNAGGGGSGGVNVQGAALTGSVSVTIGAAGAGGANLTAGASGGTTSFGSVTATGGGGGAPGRAGGTAGSPNGGAGSGQDILYDGVRCGQSGSQSTGCCECHGQSIGTVQQQLETAAGALGGVVSEVVV